MRDVGAIVRLQIQRSSLKTGEKPHRRYDPAPLLSVERLAVTPDGVLGLSDGDAWLVDVHHRAHPQTKNEDGLHGVSVGFTAHYDAITSRRAAPARTSSPSPPGGSATTSWQGALPSWTGTAGSSSGFRCSRSPTRAARSPAGRWAARSKPRCSRSTCSSWTTGCGGSTAAPRGPGSWPSATVWCCPRKALDVPAGRRRVSRPRPHPQRHILGAEVS